MQDARDRMTNMIRDLVRPTPEVTVEAHRYDGKNILILDVQASSGVVHALTIDANKPEFYVRRDGATFYAQPDEVAAIVQRGMAASYVPGLVYGG
jgi:predicted HTH transcriptional regulator